MRKLSIKTTHVLTHVFIFVQIPWKIWSENIFKIAGIDIWICIEQLDLDHEKNFLVFDRSPRN